MEPTMVTIERLEARALLSGGATAAALDPTFGRHGVAYVTNQAPAGLDTVAACKLPHGRTLLVGQGVASRLNADGSLDTTFGNGGFVHSNFIDAPAAADDQGRFVCFGGDVLNGMPVVRFNADGSVDRSFHSPALYSDKWAAIRAMAIGPDGSIFLGGNDFGASHNFTVLKLKPDGGIDTSFGTDGYATAHFYGRRGAAIDSTITTLRVDDRGRIVAAGGEDGYYDLARFNRDGTLDQTFGSRGRVQVFAGGKPDAPNAAYPYTPPPGAPVFSALAIRPSDGEIFAAGGWTIDGNHPDAAGPMLVAAFGPDGRLDGAFGRGGVVRIGVGSRGADPSQAAIDGLALTPGGQLLIAGSVAGGGFTGALLARLNADTGRLDPTFGSQLAAAPRAAAGVRFVPFALGNYDQSTVATGLLPLGDGRFVVPMDGTPPGDPVQSDGMNISTARLSAERFTADGNPDASFGTGGLADGNPLTLDGNEPLALFPAAGGSGEAYVATSGLAGQVVSRVGAGGQVREVLRLPPPDPANAAENGATIVAVQPDGQALVADDAGQTYQNGQVDLIRYNTDGTIDASFGAAGRVTFTGSGRPTVRRIAFRADGAMLVDVVNNDETYVGNHSTETLYLLDAEGRQLGSASFGTGLGYTGNDAGALADFDVAADGSVIIATAQASAGNQVVSQLQRLRAADLSLDPSFGSGGSVDLNGAPHPAVAWTPDGGVIVAADEYSRAKRQWALVQRFDSSGRLDTSFGGGGGSAQVLAPGGVTDLVVQPDGKPVVLSTWPNAHSGRVVDLARLNADGTPDGSFGPGGVAAVTFPDAAYQATSNALFLLQAGGSSARLLVASEVLPGLNPWLSPYATATAVAGVSLT